MCILSHYKIEIAKIFKDFCIYSFLRIICNVLFLHCTFFNCYTGYKPHKIHFSPRSLVNIIIPIVFDKIVSKTSYNVLSVCVCFMLHFTCWLICVGLFRLFISSWLKWVMFLRNVHFIKNFKVKTYSNSSILIFDFCYICSYIWVLYY